MEQPKDYYMMCLLIGIGVGSALGVAFNYPVVGMSIGIGMGVFIMHSLLAEYVIIIVNYM